MTSNPDLNIVIKRKGDDRLELICVGLLIIDYILPKKKDDLHQHLKTIDKDIMDNIINNVDYSSKLNLSSEICRKDLRRLANLRVLEMVLLGDNPTPTIRKFVKDLKELSTKRNLRIQIISEFLNIPWTLFYDEDLNYGEENVNPNAFWGFKHIIDNPVPIEGEFGYESRIGRKDKTDVVLSLNLGSDIEQSYIDEQKKFFSSIRDPAFSYKLREKEEDVMAAFTEKKGYGDTITYFYCHANSPLKIDSTLYDIYIRMTTQDKALTLKLLQEWSEKITFTNFPLVFINACESLSMTPFFYDHMLSFFLKKGSIAVVGTISKIPQLFANKFGIEFFKKFLTGQTLGEIFPQIRTTFRDPPYNNVLGLLYTSYCHSETVLGVRINK